MIYLPTIKQLQYLVALHRVQHFGKAAEECFVSQSTLSAGLRELESALGATLVERNRRMIRFTTLGEAVVEHAERLLQEADRIVELSRASRRPLAGDLRLGVIPTIAPFLLPALLPDLRKDWPELRLFLKEEQSFAACEALARGQLDCVLLALPYQCGDVEYEILFDDTLYFAFHESDIPNPPAHIDPDWIDQSKLLLLEDGHCLKDHALAACNGTSLRADNNILGTSLHTLVQMVENRIGMTLLPEMAIDAGILTNTSIKTRPLTSDNPVRTIALAWRANSPREEEYKLFAEALRKAAIANQHKKTNSLQELDIARKSVV